jgi:hypothetical protein
MGRVAFNNARFDGVGKDATKKTDGARSRSSTASDDGLSAQLLGLDRSSRLTGHDVLKDLVDVGFGEVLDPPGSYEGNDVPLDTAGIGDDRRGLLRPSPPSLG